MEITIKEDKNGYVIIDPRLKMEHYISKDRNSLIEIIDILFFPKMEKLVRRSDCDWRDGTRFIIRIEKNGFVFRKDGDNHFYIAETFDKLEQLMEDVILLGRNMYRGVWDENLDQECCNSEEKKESNVIGLDRACTSDPIVVNHFKVPFVTNCNS